MPKSKPKPKPKVTLFIDSKTIRKEDVKDMNPNYLFKSTDEVTHLPDVKLVPPVKKPFQVKRMSKSQSPSPRKHKLGNSTATATPMTMTPTTTANVTPTTTPTLTNGLSSATKAKAGKTFKLLKDGEYHSKDCINGEDCINKYTFRFAVLTLHEHYFGKSKNKNLIHASEESK